MYSKLKAYTILTKHRLSLLVVFSAVVSYITVSENPDWKIALYLSIGGFLITAASNGFNQIIEKHLDALMERTKERPLPLGILSNTEALIFSLSITAIGLFFLYLCSMLSAIIGFVSLLLYVLAYTPLKQKTPWSVFVGAFPGALPTLIGAVTGQAYQGSIEFLSWLLFVIQFIWQFPHFWTLAWFNAEDYKRAGFYLLPNRKKDNSAVFLIFMYSCFLAGSALLPYLFHYIGWMSALVIAIASLTLIIQAYIFLKAPSDTMAKKLFKVCIIYLPVIQLTIMTRI